MIHDEKFFAAMDCPRQVTWASDIQNLFTAFDIASMKPHGIDLSSYQDVKTNAVQIYTRVANHSMPCAESGEGPWSADWVDMFGCWIKQGFPEA